MRKPAGLMTNIPELLVDKFLVRRCDNECRKVAHLPIIGTMLDPKVGKQVALADWSKVYTPEFVQGIVSCAVRLACLRRAGAWKKL